MNIFALDPAVKKLLGWKITDEKEKWALKAIESLVKKLRKRRCGIGTFEDLEFALSHPGSRSKCITIPRSLDGRLQVSHRKALPHVIYCRVWRWPQLQSHHELKSVPDCQFPYSGRNDQVCINPYHYQRIEYPIKSGNLLQQKMSSPIVGIFNQNGNFPTATPTSSPLQHFQVSGFGLNSHSFTAPATISSSPSPCSSQFSASTSSPPFLPSRNGTSSAHSVTSPSAFFAIPPSFHNHQQLCYAQSISSPASSASSSSISQSPSALISDDEEFRQQLPVQFNGGSTIVPQSPPMSWMANPPPEYWCSLCYYELNTRVGEPFKLTKKVVTVDGFTAPFSESETEERVCLGLLSNVNRNVTIENTRKHIGKGIRITCSETQISLFNASNSAVFVQSRNANFKFNLQSTAVCRVPPQATMMLFDFQLFSGILEKVKSEGYSHVYELQKMCYVRISFVKGWGADYQRKDITSTPCWLEMQLNQPLTWIDGILFDMEPPQHMDVTSVS